MRRWRASTQRWDAWFPTWRSGVGAFCTQHHHVPTWGEPALDLLAAGRRPEAVLAELLKGDREPELRQLGIVDMKGQTAVHNPTAAPPGSRYWAAMTGRHYCVQGNTLAGREVITEMAKGYEDTKGSFTDRLLASLLAGDVAGGDHRGRLAAGVRVAKTGAEGYWFELYVDESDDAVLDLMKKYSDRKHDARGEWKVDEAVEGAAGKAEVEGVLSRVRLRRVRAPFSTNVEHNLRSNTGCGAEC